LPESVLVKSQFRAIEKTYTEDGSTFRIVVKLRFDDECGNGHNTFAMTGSIYEKNSHGRWVDLSGGCIHEDIVKHFPKLAPLVKWHLTSTDGPMHYLQNTVFLAGDRDCFGGVEGEVRLWKYGVQLPNGNPLWMSGSWKAGEIYSENQEYAEKMVEQIEGSKLIKVPSLIHEGKARELEAARRAAVWPEASDEVLSADPVLLRQVLIDRLPFLMMEFKAAMESLEFKY